MRRIIFNPLVLLSSVGRNAILMQQETQTAEHPPLAPVAWIHIPKTGTSFVNTLIHHPEICPNVPEEDFVVGAQHIKFWQDHPKEEFCPGGFSQTYPAPPHHFGIGPVYNQNRGRIISFFRNPTARLISAYNHAQHSWPGSLPRAKNIQEFANVVQGCQARMLTRAQCVGHDIPAPMSTEEIQMASNRVWQMNFVGLTEEWDFSICLFHAIYGGTCHEQEFVNTRPHTRLDEADGLRGFVDPMDTPVFETAHTHFWELIERYGLDRKACHRICPGGHFQLPINYSDSSNLYRFEWPGRKYGAGKKFDVVDDEYEDLSNFKDISNFTGYGHVQD